MLIIAIPKSASTALVSTLCETHDLPCVTSYIRDRVLLRRPIAPSYTQLARFHRRDLVEIDAQVAGLAAARGSIAKFHFPPTPRNQALLAGVPKLVLLRDAEQIVSAYRRGEESGAFATKNHEFSYCLSDASWQARARETGLLGELHAFAEGWRAHTGNQLVIDYRELLEDTQRTLARVEAYFALPSSGRRELRQERFSRQHAGAGKRSPTRILFGRRVLVAKRILADASRLAVGNTTRLDAWLETLRRSELAPLSGRE